MNEQDLGLYKKWNFPTGEVGIALNTLKEPLVLRWKQDTDIMEWLQVIDAYMHHNPIWDGVVTIPYLPYSRQDKVHSFGESAAVNILLTALKNMGVKRIVTWDIHNSRFIPKPSRIFDIDFIENKFADRFFPGCKYICYPDSNAYFHGYSQDFSKQKNKEELIFLEKNRLIDDIILEFRDEEFNHSQLGRDRSVIIKDDICDGGGTFIKAAELLKTKDYGPIHLFVTHGFFTKGLDVLYEAGIDKIITTNTVCDLPETDKLKIIKVC